MDKLQMISYQQPGLVSIDNFDEVKKALTQALAQYENIVYTADNSKDANKDRKELSRLRREIDDRRKEIKNAYLAPYNTFENRVKELLALIDVPLEQAKAFLASINDQEKQDKRAKIEAYFYQNSTILGDLAPQVWDSPAFFEPKWLNKTTSTKEWQNAVDEKILAAAYDIQNIQIIEGQHTSALTTHYLETLSTDNLAQYSSRLAAVSQMQTLKMKMDAQDYSTGSKVLRLSGNQTILNRILEILTILEVDYEIIEDANHQIKRELTVPNFDSFVAFDLETSGTYGAANGDTPAEITEIGAVRIVGGEIADRFSMLVNPGRKILPRISRITGITDEMVARQPDVVTAIRLFADFVEDNILVGHNIKASDLHYIHYAAQRAGIRLENSFFDTLCFARTLKKSQGWKSVKLEYLSEQLGVEQSNAHRAWCDAEAVAGIYFKMQGLRA